MDTKESEQYLSTGQSKKLLAFGVIAALTSLPITGTPGIPLVDKIANALLGAFTAVLEFVASIIAQAIFGSLGFLFTAGTREFLFFAPPGQVESLNAVWWDFVPIFWGILPVAGLAFFLGMQLFPEKEEADIYRFMERALIAGIGLLILGPMFTFDVAGTSTLDLFSAIVYAVNEIGLHIFPEEYTLRFMQGSINSVMGGLTALGGMAATIIAVALLGWKFAIAVLLVVGAFYIVLAMRMLLIYSVYAMMPLFLALWVVDIGPMKYGKMVASLVWKLTAVLLLLGIIISGILATTGAIAGQSTTDDVQFAGDEYNNSAPSGGLIGNDGEISGTEDVEGGDTASAEPPSGFTRVILQMFAWFGGIVLCIALTTSLLGMVISMRGSSGVSSRMRQGRTGDAPTGPQVYGGGGGGGSAGAAAGGAAGGAAAGGVGGGGVAPTTVPTNGGGGGAPPMSGAEDTITRGDDSTFINPANSDEKLVMDDDGGMSTFSQSDNAGTEGVPVRDKAKHVGGKYGGKANDYVKGKTGVDVGSKAKGVAETASGVGKAAYDKVPDSAKKLGNLGKRGGQAYWSVFKQPDVGSSIGEMGRIARESPIGHPDKPGGSAGGEDGPIDAEEATVDDFDLDATQGHQDAEGYDVSGDLGPRTEGTAEANAESGPTDDGAGEPDRGTATINDLKNNASEFEDEPFDMEEVEFQEESTTTIEQNGESKEMQKGELVDPETGDSFKHVGFGTDGDAPKLEDGETYNLQNAEMREYQYDKYGGALAHRGKSSNYQQVRLDGTSGATKVQSNSTPSSDSDGSSGMSSGVSESGQTEAQTSSSSADDLNLPDGKDTVLGTLQDYNINSPAGHEGYTSFDQRSNGNSYSSGNNNSDAVTLDGNDSQVSKPSSGQSNGTDNGPSLGM